LSPKDCLCRWRWVASSRGDCRNRTAVRYPREPIADYRPACSFYGGAWLRYWMGLDVDCGCFGPEDPEAEAFHGLRLSLYRDLAMMAGVFFIYGWRRYRAIRPTGVMVIVNQLFNKRRKKDAYG
jgi:hypothetical protein